MGSVRKAKEEDLRHLTPRLREADRREVTDISGLSVYEALFDAFHQSVECYTILSADNSPIGIFGVVPIFKGQAGCPWMVATDDLRKEAKQFMSECHIWINKLLDLFPTLTNFVDARNTVAIQWLKCVGFNLRETYDNFGAAGIKVIHFDMHKRST